MSEIKNLYKIPVTITTFDSSLKKKISLQYKPEVTLNPGQSLGIAIEIAKRKAQYEFFLKYPAHKINSIDVDIDKREFICKLKIKDKPKKTRVRKLPFTKEPTEKPIEYLGKDKMGRQYIEIMDKGRKLMIILLKGERATFNFKWNRLIVTYYQNKVLQYVKILSEDIDGNPVLTKWDLNSLTTKHPHPYVEYLWDGGNFSNSISLDEYKSCLRIVKNKFKKYLTKKGGER